MRWVMGTAFVVFLAAGSIVLLSRSLFTSQDSSVSFWGNFLLNFSTELIGFSFAGVVSYFLAKKLASQKFKELSEPFIELIRELRKGETISRQAARQTVKVTVQLLSDDQIKPALKALHIKSKDQRCGVCDLDADVDDKADNSCRFCGLDKKLWSNSAPPA